MTTPTMTIDGVEYVEATPQQTGPDWDDVCSQCEFDDDGGACMVAYERAQFAFGGDCCERGVIYIRKA